MKIKHAIVACATTLCFGTVVAAPTATYHGQWKSVGGETLIVNASGVKSYTEMRKECTPQYFKLSNTQHSGAKLQSTLQTTLKHNQQDLASSQSSDNSNPYPNNIRNIQRILPLVNTKQTYNSITVMCMDGAKELIFINPQNAVEIIDGGGETLFELYRK